MTAILSGTRLIRVVSLNVWHSSRLVALQKGLNYDEIIGCNQRSDPDL
jgi:hypothetical protein